MKKYIVVSILCITTNLIAGLAHADEQETKPIKLKSKCIKQNPLVENQTDQALLGIYQQVCDKADTANKNDLLAQAAMRMYELKQPMNALKLVNQLQQQGVTGNMLTDVTFLSSVAMASDSLQHMRSGEMRYLSNELTYPPAKELSEQISAALPAPDTSHTKAITDETLSKARNGSNTAIRHTTTRPKVQSSSARNSSTPVKRPAVAAPVAPKSAAPTVQKTAANPFDALK